MSDKLLLEGLLVELKKESSLKKVLSSSQTIFDGENLLALDLNDLGISSLEEKVFHDFKNLSKLSLSFNNLSSLPSTIFNKVPKLNFINLYGNNLTELPEAIFEGMEVSWLDLRSNGLTKLPKSLANQEKIENLFLQNNPELGKFNEDYHGTREVKSVFPDLQKALS